MISFSDSLYFPYNLRYSYIRATTFLAQLFRVEVKKNNPRDFLIQNQQPMPHKVKTTRF